MQRAQSGCQDVTSCPELPAASPNLMQQALQQVYTHSSMWWGRAGLPADHPLMLMLATAAAVGIYIASEPLRLASGTWAVPCPILSSILHNS